MIEASVERREPRVVDLGDAHPEPLLEREHEVQEVELVDLDLVAEGHARLEALEVGVRGHLRQGAQDVPAELLAARHAMHDRAAPDPSPGAAVRA